MQNTLIGIIGLGMVGTPLKRWFEEFRGYERGKDIFLYDIDPKKGYFDDVAKADVIFVAVPSPRNPDGSCNISIVEEAVRSIKGGKIVVIKSTVPAGTTELLQKKNPQHKILFSPEFLTERRAWEDMMRPDRQIVGFTAQSIDASHLVLSLLPKAPFMSPWGLNTYTPIKITATEAEIIKYGGNVHFVRKINFANALARFCAKMEKNLKSEGMADNGVDYENVRRGMSADHRIGDSHLDVNHGGYKGWGGYCFPKDSDALASHFASVGLTAEAELLKADRKFNEKILAEQGLTIEEVSTHDEILEQKLKALKTQNLGSGN
ncbi:MAG: hypothetical protein Q7S66_05295 [bacterium]|nr:hypothetical protein [bacterium]